MKIILNTKEKYTKVIESATIELSVSEARALYAVTEFALKNDVTGDVTIDEEEQSRRNALIREFTRSLAKRILITSGEITPLNDMLKDLKNV